MKRVNLDSSIGVVCDVDYTQFRKHHRMICCWYVVRASTRRHDSEWHEGRAIQPFLDKGKEYSLRGACFR
jgi:hypothetical protein